MESGGSVLHPPALEAIFYSFHSNHPTRLVLSLCVPSLTLSFCAYETTPPHRSSVVTVSALVREIVIAFVVCLIGFRESFYCSACFDVNSIRGSYNLIIIYKKILKIHVELCRTPLLISRD